MMPRRRFLAFVSCIAVAPTAAALAPPGGGTLKAPKPPPDVEEILAGEEKPDRPYVPDGPEQPTRVLGVAEAVPRDAVFFVCLPDAKQALSGIRGIQGVRIFEERDIARRWKAIAKRARRASKGGGAVWRLMRATGVDLLEALGRLGEEMCLAVVTHEGPQVVFVADVGGRKADVHDLVLSVVQNFGDYESDSHVYKGVEVSALIGEEDHYSYAFLDNLFIVATGRRTIEKTIDAAMDYKDASVLARALHRRSRRLAGDADLYFFAQLTGLAEDLKGLLPGELGAALTMVIEAGARNAYGYCQMESRGMRDVIRLEGEAETAPLPPVLVQKFTEQSLVPYVPLEANFYLSAQVDFAGLVKAFSARGSFFREHLLKFKPRVGERLAGLAKGLSGELAIARFTPLGRAEPETVVIAGLMDREKASSALAEMQETAEGSFSTEKWGDAEIVRAEKGALLDLGPVKFTACALSPDAVLLGTSASAVKKCVRQSQFKAANVAADEDFQRAVENLSPDGSLVAYLDPRGVVDSEYAKKLKELREKKRQRGVSLPRADSFKDHLFGVGLVGAARGAEFVVESFGPLGALSGGAAWYLLRLPELGEGPDRPKREQLSRLMRVCASLYLYAGDFERFPVSLAELYPNYISLTAFGDKVKAIEDIDLRGEFGYVPGRKLDDLGDEVIVFSKPTSSGDRRRSVLFVGGYVETLDEDVFQAMLRGER